MTINQQQKAARRARNKRYWQLHAAEIKLKRDAISDEKKQEDRAHKRTAMQTERAKLTRQEKAAVQQKDRDAHRLHVAAMNDEQRKLWLERMRATTRRLYQARKHGPKQFVIDRAAQYTLDSEQHRHYLQLADPGFVVIHSACDKHRDWLTRVRRIVRTEKGESLFSRVDRHGKLQYSAKRKQYSMSSEPEFQAEVVAWLVTFIRQVLDEYVITDACVLANGICGAQPAHCDIRDQSHLWENDPPLSGIVALENGTSLLIMRDSLEDYGGKLEKVVLNAGDVLVFHGLLVHAGSGYTKVNKRIHFTALTKSGKSRPINETFVVMSK
jgi:hypothetical protein